jgi:hypothetical protein
VQGDIVLLQVEPVRDTAKVTKPASSPRVAITVLEDGRPQKGRLGTGTDLWGSVSSFDVLDGNPGEVVARALATYFRYAGWQAEVVKPGGTSQGADVALSGTVQELAVNAKSMFGSTKITAQVKLSLQALNVADGSQVRMTLSSTGSDRVFWFEPENAQAVLNDVLTQSFDKLMQSTQVDQKGLRLK